MNEQGGERMPSDSDSDRRGFLAKSAGIAMAGSLAASYGTLAAYAIRYLLPADPDAGMAWQFIAPVKELPVGESFEFTSPAGEKVVIARQVNESGTEGFQALSSVCPHLGCRVHWEPANRRFFCPCHNGVFTPDGVATEGPPAKAKQRLKSFELQVVEGMLFVKVRTTPLQG